MNLMHGEVGLNASESEVMYSLGFFEGIHCWVGVDFERYLIADGRSRASAEA